MRMIFALIAVIVSLIGCMREIALTPQAQVGTSTALPISVKIEISESISKGKGSPILFDIKQATTGYFNSRGTFREIVDAGADVVLKMNSRFAFEGKDTFHYSFDIQNALQGGGKQLGNYHVTCDASGSPVRFTSEADRVPMNKALTDCLDRLAGQIEADGPAIMAKLHGLRVEPMASNLLVAAAPTIKSDVDELPQIKTKANKNAYAIVIGIEQYRQKLPAADFASQDAKLVTDYLTKVLKYPEENVITLINDRAGLGDFVKYFEKWLPNNIEAGSTVFVYYSGHGAPNPKTSDAYLVPYDGDPAFIDETGYSLKRMYAALGKLPAKEVIVALDSCFSGAGGRSVLAKGSRPIVLSVESPVLANKNMTVLSASAGDQVSSTYDEKGHGLFTYFLLKGIKNEDVVRKDGSLDISSLYDYVKPQVTSIARKKYNNEQTPQLIGAKNKQQ